VCGQGCGGTGEGRCQGSDKEGACMFEEMVAEKQRKEDGRDQLSRVRCQLCPPAMERFLRAANAMHTSQCCPEPYQDVLNFGCTLEFHCPEPEGSRQPPRSHRMLKKPSSSVTSDSDDLLELTWDDLLIEGERLFHTATMLRTELSGERGDACGRLRP